MSAQLFPIVKDSVDITVRYTSRNEWQLRCFTWKEKSDTAQKMKFPIKDFFSKCDQIADLVAFTEEILNAKLHFLWTQNWLEYTCAGTSLFDLDKNIDFLHHLSTAARIRLFNSTE